MKIFEEMDVELKRGLQILEEITTESNKHLIKKWKLV